MTTLQHEVPTRPMFEHVAYSLRPAVLSAMSTVLSAAELVAESRGNHTESHR